MHKHKWIKSDDIDVWWCPLCRRSTARDPFRKRNWKYIKKYLYQKYYDWSISRRR
jgi:hypothetical protein